MTKGRAHRSFIPHRLPEVTELREGVCGILLRQSATLYETCTAVSTAEGSRRGGVPTSGEQKSSIGCHEVCLPSQASDGASAEPGPRIPWRSLSAQNIPVLSLASAVLQLLLAACCTGIKVKQQQVRSAGLTASQQLSGRPELCTGSHMNMSVPKQLTWM